MGTWGPAAIPEGLRRVFLKNYIVRIYRHDEKDSNKVIGVLEHVEEELQASFSSMEELVNLLRKGNTSNQIITEEGVKRAIENGPSDNGPDWGEIRFEKGKIPGTKKTGERKQKD